MINFDIDKILDKAQRKFDVVIYSHTVDLIGNRVTPREGYSEIVHHLKIYEEMVNTSLETVTTEFVQINYEIQFYLSSGPMTFTKKIKEVPIVF